MAALLRFSNGRSGFYPRVHFLAIALLISCSITQSLAQVKIDTTASKDSSIVIHIHSSDTVVVISDTTRSRGILSEIQNEEQSKGDSKKINPKSVLETISVSKVLFSIIFIIVAYFIIKLVTKLLNLFAERSTRYRITIKGI